MHSRELSLFLCFPNPPVSSLSCWSCGFAWRTAPAPHRLLLHAVLLLQLEVLLVQGVDAVDHLLHQLHLGVAQAVLVRDVVGVSWTTAA